MFRAYVGTVRDVDDFRNGCCYKKSCLPVTPPFHHIGDEKSGKEERHGSFGAMIIWNDVRRSVLKIEESERIYVPAVPLTIVAVLAAVPMLVSRGMIGASVQHAPG